MEEQIVKFIAALRAAGVRISLAESADAYQAVDRLGVINREAFRLGLQATLIKEYHDFPAFHELFPIFFGAGGLTPATNIEVDLASSERQMLEDSLLEFSAQIRKALDKLIKGDKLTQPELERLARFVGLNQIDELRYREWMIQRMEKALHSKEIQEAIKELAGLLEQNGMDKDRVQQLQTLLQANQKAIDEQIRQFVGQQIAENMSQRAHPQGIDDLFNRSFSTLTEQDMERLRKEVARLAAILKTRVALRQKRARTGQLDAKATIRSNLKHGNVPIEIKHRDRILKPRLVIICDISTSMRSCSELMLGLIYALQDQVKKTFSFAFINHLEYISPDLEGNQANQAIGRVLDRIPSGYYNTDLGSSLEDFSKDYLDMVDSRTTFIVVGDGRNNYNNPRLELFNSLARRSRRMIWLNPEPSVLWGTGDSDMLKYAPGCEVVLQAGSLAELTSEIDKLF